ncbi:RNA polymerase sigma factor, RpoD/SigA family [Synechococcus sp. FGCU-3]|nr:RNA polymerase sigma factor, RpoD/SigA family [Synechococcus sp. FGCU3]
MPSPLSTDLVRQYLQEIGRVPLLADDEELLLAREVQRCLAVEAQRGDGQWDGWTSRCGLSEAELRLVLHHGRRARSRMIQANLRLVVAVAKKYQGRGVELLDLVQEGTLGLERAVDRFDPTRGFRFSTYAFWWIRQGITRALSTQSRTIRLPVHVMDKLNRIRRAQAAMAMQLGRMPSIAEISRELEVEPEWIRTTLDALRPPLSLERRVGRERDTELGELLEDPHSNPDAGLVREALHADLEQLLQRLSEREAAVIRQRFGLDDDQPRTLTEIGQGMQISRERVRQLEARALGKLRQPRNRCQVRDYLSSLDR